MNNAKPTHVLPAHLEIADGCLRIGGIAVTRLAQRAGSTPFYVYDRAAIDVRVAHVRAHMPQEIKLHYSIKANPMPAVVQHLSSLVDGFDVASAGELKVALDTTMPATQIAFAGPGKTDAELARAIAAGVAVTIESEHQLESAERIGKELGITARVHLRINPEFELKTSGMKMSGGPKQFGVDAERAPQLLQRMSAMNVQFEGIHIFCGSQNLRADAIIEAHNNTFELALRLRESAPCAVRHLNIGGGFGIPYFAGEQPLDIAPIGENLERWLTRMKADMPDTEVILELGRYLVGEAGMYVTRVIDRKVSCGQVFLITDGGMHHHLAASGNLGQVIRKNYPVVVGNKMNAAERETVTITGPLCTPLDILADKVELPPAQIGDLIVVFQSGAYGLSASPQAFLSHPAPQEMLV
jgi:diaminopimelate decarboxylase